MLESILMKLYIVRHAESEANSKKVYQEADSPLSQVGLEQAKIVAERIKKIEDIHLIVSSPMKRAKQTAEEISTQTGLEIVFNDYAAEHLWPKELVGKGFGDAEITIREFIRKKLTEPEWKYSTEDNYFERKERIIHLLSDIESYKDKNILLVSHGFSIRMLVALLMFGPDVTPQQVLHIEEFLKTTNTGITLCEKEEEDWRMTTWNDHAHLG